MSAAAVIERLLTEQADLTAAGRFSRAHDAGCLDLRKGTYESLIPLARPRSSGSSSAHWT